MGTSGRCKWVNVYSYKFCIPINFSAKIHDASQSMIFIIYFFSCCKFQGDGQEWKKKKVFAWKEFADVCDICFASTWKVHAVLCIQYQQYFSDGNIVVKMVLIFLL